MTEYERRAELHDKFWRRENPDHLVGFCPGDYFISRRFAAAKPLLDAGREIKPDDIDPESYMPDYERMYEDALDHGGDLFYTPEPMPGIPWLEAMSGFPVRSGPSSFFAMETENLEAGKIVCRDWQDKYLKFMDVLSVCGEGRYICGQPIMRGPSDLLGTGIGQQQLIFDMTDRPGDVRQKLDAFADLLLDVLALSNPKSMFGGYAMGFYHLWCPDRCLWFQDDLTAIMSPDLYKEFLYKIHTRLAGSAPYTMIHLHMTSSYIIEDLLKIDELNAIQVNKDIGEPIEPMIPVLKKIQSEKNLVLWGDFSTAELNMLREELDPRGVYIIVFGAE